MRRILFAKYDMARMLIQGSSIISKNEIKIRKNKFFTTAKT